MITLIAAALVTAAPAPTAPDSHGQMQHHATGDCCCEHMAKADGRDCCAEHGASTSGEHAGHSAQ